MQDIIETLPEPLFVNTQSELHLRKVEDGIYISIAAIGREFYENHHYVMTRQEAGALHAALTMGETLELRPRIEWESIMCDGISEVFVRFSDTIHLIIVSCDPPRKRRSYELSNLSLDQFASKLQELRS